MKQSSVINKMAKKEILSNRRSIIFTIITVIIAAAIVMTILLSVLGMEKERLTTAEKLPQFVINNINDEEIKRLNNDRNINNIRAIYLFNALKTSEGQTLNVVYYDNDNYFNDVDLDGKIPQKANEIVIPRESIKYFSEKLTVGESVKLDLGKGKMNYVISGFTEEVERPNSITIHCSREYLLDYLGDSPLYYTVAYISLENANRYSELELEKKKSELIDKYSINSDRIAIYQNYLNAANNQLEASEILPILLIIIFILIASAIVIYSIFYISVSNKVRDYGQLRTIGMTKKQINQMIIKEGRILSTIGSAIGVIIGCGMGYLVRPLGWSLVNCIISGLITIIFSVVIVFLSIRLPAKVAGGVSPMEALHFTGYINEAFFIKQRKRELRITPLKLAVLNMNRNPKKSSLIILSLMVCGTILLCSASLRNSISAENMARETKFQYGSFLLEFDGDRELLNKMESDAQIYSTGALQAMDNKMTDKLLNQITAFDGVKGIKEWYGTTAVFSTKEGDVSDQTTVWGYDSSDAKKLANSCTEGTVDYEKLMKGNGIVLNISDNIFEEVYHFTPAIGDEIVLSFWQNNGTPIAHTFTVMGLTDGQDGFEGIIRMPVEKMIESAGYNCSIMWEIIVDDTKYNTVEREMQSFVSKNVDFSLITFNDYVSTLEASYKAGIYMMYLLTIFLGFFGIINMINLIVSNHIIRRKEIGLLLAVGMTRKQLVISNIVEGELLVIISIVFSGIIGVPIGHFIVNSFKMTGAVRTYQFPISDYFVFVILLLVIVFLLSFTLNSNIRKKTIIEQINF